MSCLTPVSFFFSHVFGGSCLVVLFGLARQAEKLRNLIVSEVADWQVLTLRLAAQLEALKRSMTGDGDGDGDVLTDKSSQQVQHGI